VTVQAKIVPLSEANTLREVVDADAYVGDITSAGEGESYREVSYRLGLSRNTLMDIVKRDRA
jgi:transposase